MPIKPLYVQRRMMELGRVRLGEKGSKGEPRKLSTLRFTSASRELLEKVAERWGGQVREWPNAPEQGYWQVTTETAEIEIVLPPIFSEADGSPTLPVSQWFELWSGGGCQRRCDGETEALSGKPCMCNPDERACKPTTRLSFLLPDIPGLGVWRLETHGYNAAAELPGTLTVLTKAAHEGKFVPATLRIDHRTKKQNGETLRFIVPTVELRGVTINQMARGELPLSLNAPQPNPPKPELPPAAAEPEPEPFENDKPPAFGEEPKLPDVESQPQPAPEPESLPLDVETFKQLCDGSFISPQKITAFGRKMFPGKTRDTLTDEERGQLWQALADDLASVKF